MRPTAGHSDPLLTLAGIGDLSRCWLVKLDGSAHLLQSRRQCFDPLLLPGDFGCEGVLLLGYSRLEFGDCALLFCLLRESGRAVLEVRRSANFNSPERQIVASRKTERLSQTRADPPVSTFKLSAPLPAVGLSKSKSTRRDGVDRAWGYAPPIFANSHSVSTVRDSRNDHARYDATLVSVTLR
jgi:hypothetical protein